MRPHLCRLGGLVADGVLLNWMLPPHAAEARGWVHDGAAAAGRTAPVTALYIRVTVGHDATRRLRDEEGRYRRLAAAHFAAMNAALGTVGVSGSARDGVVEALTPHRSAVALPIVRVLAGMDRASLMHVRGGGAIAPRTPPPTSM